MASKPHMFSKIFDFRYQRTLLQSIGFYFCQLIIFFLLTGVVLGFMIAAGLGDVSHAEQERTARIMGPVFGLIHALCMAIFMLKAKNLDNSLNHVLIGALALALGGVGQALFSLIPIAWMSTRPVAPTLEQG